MSEAQTVTVAEQLAGLAADPAQHNRWKKLATYTNQGSAKARASALRKSHGDQGFSFTLVNGGAAGWFLAVMYKAVDADGRVV